GVSREMQIGCRTSERPSVVKMYVSEMMPGRQLRVSDVPVDTGKMQLITEPERVIARVVTLRVEEEKPVEAVAAEVAAPAEPEVIKKGKKEAEGEEAVEAEAKPKAEKTEKTEKTEKKK